MKDNVEITRKIVVGFTIVWVIFWIIYAVSASTNLDESNYNNWGDFLAGTSAPLAFAWLIYGYFMQAKELKKNSELIEKQLTEIRESVKHQGLIAEATETEVQVSKTMLENEQKKYEVQFSPRFVFKQAVAGGTPTAGFIQKKLVFCNMGLEAHAIKISGHSLSYQLNVKDNHKPSIAEREEFSLIIEYSEGLEKEKKYKMIIEIDYVNCLGYESKLFLAIEFTKGNIVVFPALPKQIPSLSKGS
ncbi:hypothetical protein FLL45_20860 [Aliikangiella marina]|uniref:Uncharacterized protein n=1 Tax=Aliikangiella marina TaxID=1712262 RepID=A0A545T306_9GAMM|nr:hypothetical protein [Aliikangiella marina]TQV71603.1 hypothetical protein FLL45_20860 [Aliikangiella marina]